MNPFMRVSVVLLGAMLVGLPACTGGPRTFPVKGKVMYNGKPVPKGLIQFTPVKGGPTATGQLNEDGTYSLGTYTPGDGASIGEYRVVIMAMESLEGRSPHDAPLPPIIPDKYSSLALSDLKAEVHEGDNICDFTLVGSIKKPTAAEIQASPVMPKRR
jgi:hypothetical protein